MRAGVLSAPAIIEDRRRTAEVLNDRPRRWWTAPRVSRKPSGSASGVKVTVEKGGALRRWKAPCVIFRSRSF